MYPAEWGEQLGRDPSKKWELQIHCFKEFLLGRELGLVPSSRPHSLGYACTLYAPHFPCPKKVQSHRWGRRKKALLRRTSRICFADVDASKGVGQGPPSYGSGRYGLAFFGLRIPFCAADALWGGVTHTFGQISKYVGSLFLGLTEL